MISYICGLYQRVKSYIAYIGERKISEIKCNSFFIDTNIQVNIIKLQLLSYTAAFGSMSYYPFW